MVDRNMPVDSNVLIKRRVPQACVLPVSLTTQPRQNISPEPDATRHRVVGNGEGRRRLPNSAHPLPNGLPRDTRTICDVLPGHQIRMSPLGSHTGAGKLVDKSDRGRRRPHAFRGESQQLQTFSLLHPSTQGLGEHLFLRERQQGNDKGEFVTLVQIIGHSTNIAARCTVSRWTHPQVRDSRTIVR